MTEAAVGTDGKSKDKVVPLGMKNGLASQWSQSTSTFEGTRSKEMQPYSSSERGGVMFSAPRGKSVLMARDWLVRRPGV